LVTIFNAGTHFTIHVESNTFAVVIMVTSVSVLPVYLAYLGDQFFALVILTYRVYKLHGYTGLFEMIVGVLTTAISFSRCNPT